jgi:hypothetical protein
MVALYNHTDSDIKYLEFEIAIAANTSSTSINLEGLEFEEGLYAVTNDTTNSIVTVSYDY